MLMLCAKMSFLLRKIKFPRQPDTENLKQKRERHREKGPAPLLCVIKRGCLSGAAAALCGPICLGADTGRIILFGSLITACL